MKKKTRTLLGIGMAVIMGFSVFSMGACDLFSTADQEVYSVMYYDGTEHIIEARNGKHYSLDKIPERFGYTFTGLFDEETGGVQYVSADGNSINPYSRGQADRLYPQFTPNRYAVKLDYGGASATEGVTLSAEYGKAMPKLPADLNLTGKEFCGWFSKPDCGGIKVSGADGVSQTIVDEDSFPIDDPEGITLFAGFKTKMVTVVFRTDTGSFINSVQAEYGSYLADHANSVRVNGMAVLRWNQSTAGKVTEDAELIAEEYAPVIELDCRGGNGASEIIAPAGESICLPAPQKEFADFLYWEDENGKEFTQTVMPDRSIRLRAVWQPKIVLDSNGGSAVEDIAQKAGTAVVLPSPARSGYLFAGWFTESGEMYTATVMPEEGMILKAGWCLKKTVRIDFRTGTQEYYVTDESKFCKVDLSEYNPNNFNITVSVKLHFEAKHYSGTSIVFDGFNDLSVGYYSQATTLKQYALCPAKRLPHDKVRDYRVYNLEQKDIVVADSLFFIGFTCGSNYNGVKVKNCYAEVEYPDYAHMIL